MTRRRLIREPCSGYADHGCFTNTAEMMPADNSLESFTFRHADYVNIFAFDKDIHVENITECLLVAGFKTGEFSYDPSSV